MSAESAINEHPYEIIGPTEEYAVVVKGRRVPSLQAKPEPGGKLLLMLDNRHALEVDVATAERVVPFLAECIAFGMGYASHGGPELPPFRPMVEL